MRAGIISISYEALAAALGLPSTSQIDRVQDDFNCHGIRVRIIDECLKDVPPGDFVPELVIQPVVCSGPHTRVTGYKAP